MSPDRVASASSRSIAAVVLLLWAASGARAADISEGLADHSVTSWAEADGRPLGSVYAIAQASDGYLWIGSDAGLFRFDGWRFVHWDSLSDTPLPNAPVTAVSVSRDGSIWVGFASAQGLRQLRDGRIVSSGSGADQLGFVDAIEEERSGTRWAVAQNKLYRLDRGSWRHVSVSGGEVEPFSRVVNLRPRRSGGMFVLTSDGVFQQESSGAFTRITGPPDPSGARLSAWTWDIGEGSDDSLWTTDMAAGFKQRVSGSDAWSQPESRVMGYRLLHDRRGGVWVGTIGEGLWRVLPAPRPQRWTIERITLTTGLTSNSVRSIVEDRDGNVWVGTTAGLHRLSRRKLTPISDVGLAISLEALPDGDMLVGTSNGLVAFRRGARQSLARRSMAPGVWAVQSHMDGRGVQWVGSTEGAYRLQGSQLIPVDGLQGRLVRFIASDAGGRVWFGAGNAVYRTEAGRAEVTPFEIPKEWGVTGVSTMLKDHAGRLWLVATNGGLGRLDPDGAIPALRRCAGAA